MLDEQTKRSVETMCLCGLDIDGLKSCFPGVSETELAGVYEYVKNNRYDNSDEELLNPGGISCCGGSQI